MQKIKLSEMRSLQSPLVFRMVEYSILKILVRTINASNTNSRQTSSCSIFVCRSTDQMEDCKFVLVLNKSYNNIVIMSCTSHFRFFSLNMLVLCQSICHSISVLPSSMVKAPTMPQSLMQFSKPVSPCAQSLPLLQ